MKKKISHRRRGAALLAIIMFVAVLTLMLLSYLIAMQMDQLSTNSYSHSIRAEEIGKGGLQEIISDLRAEIDAGSVASSSYTVDGIRTYVPKSNFSALPARIGYTASDYAKSLVATDPVTLPPSLIRVSRASDPFYTSPDSTRYITSKLPANLASAASSTTPSGNGRVLTTNRWNSPLLMPDGEPSTAGTQVPSPFSAKPPDWIYVTRSGSQVCTDAEVASGALAADPAGKNPKGVIGRYAYVMYDEGALLDVNVAGYPANASANPAPFYTDTAKGISQALGGKSYVAYADLTQLPGLIGKQDAVDKLVNWRIQGGLAKAAIPSPKSFFKAISSYAPKGFTEFESGDSPILSRQDLIQYFKQLKQDGLITDLSALAYLGTFSRSLNMPQWTPRADASATPNAPGSPTSTGRDGTGNIYAYKTNAESDSAANRNLLTLRLAADSNITHYDDEGVSTTPLVKKTGPFLQKRFSLAKLAWLTPKGPSASLPTSDPQYNAGGTAAAILYCFGLEWKPSSNPNVAPYWDYVAATPAPGVQIKTLKQVVDEKREPNFFELLKAGILSGSLGKHPGDIGPMAVYSPPAPDWPPTTYEGVPSLEFVKYSGDKDRQIVQIGANIIDQADVDSFPTAIRLLNFAEGATPGRKLENFLFGNENLPYLTRLWQLGAESSERNIIAWLQPEIWNPHQNVPSATPLVPPPTSFRVRAYGKALTQWNLTGDVSLPSGTSPTITYDSSVDPDSAGVVYFKDTATGKTTSTFYNKPAMITRIHADTAQGTTDPLNTYGGGNTSARYLWAWMNTGTQPIDQQFMGIRAGSVEGPSKNPTDPWMVKSDKYHLRIGYYPSRLTVTVECWDGQNWRPYSVFSRIEARLTNDVYNSSTGNGPFENAPVLTGNISSERGGDNFLHPDPRTDRFSVGSNRANGGDINGQFTNGRTMEPLGVHGCENYMPKTTNHPAPGGDPTNGFTMVYPAPKTFPDPVPKNAPWPNYGGMPLTAWAVNDPLATPFAGLSLNAYYTDPDAMVRPGDGYYRSIATGDGCSLFHSTNLTPSASARRPVILNRPFRSVAELGYAYRDQPFKSLDFFTPYSADAGLLDLFSVSDEKDTVAGQVNINSAPFEVIQAIIAGTVQNESGATPVVITNKDSGGVAKGDANGDARTVAFQISEKVKTSPLVDRADLATSLAPAIQTGFLNPLGTSIAAVKTANKANKSYAEAPTRALSSVTNLRTWNLMIDIIAQSGTFGKSTSGTGALNSAFIVQGEKRYWLHISIDRYTGAVIDQNLESVYE